MEAKIHVANDMRNITSKWKMIFTELGMRYLRCTSWEYKVY